MLFEVKREMNKLINTYLDSFGVLNQFIELKFSNDKYDEIKFFIDCHISSSDTEVNNKKVYFDKIDEDVSAIVYFIKANRRKVIDFEIIDNKFELKFDNGYNLFFIFEENDEQPLAITFKEKGNSLISSRIIFDENEVIIRND